MEKRGFTCTTGLRAEGPPKTPLTPGSNHPTTPPSPIVQRVQHSPVSPTSATPPASLPTGGSPPLPPPKPKKSIFRARNIYVVLFLSALGYGGAIWYSFHSDNFHDFFTEYVPGSKLCVHAVQDYQYTQRYPGSPVNKAGKTSDLARKGPHISALQANRPEVIEKKKEYEKKEKEEAKKKGEQSKKGKGKGKSEEEQKGPTLNLVPKTETPPQTSEAAKKEVQKEPPAKRDPQGAAPQADTKLATDAKPSPKDLEGESKPPAPSEPKTTAPISAPVPSAAKQEPPTPLLESDSESTASYLPGLQHLQIALLDISPNDPVLEKVTTALNDLISTINSQPTYDATSGHLYEFLKSSIADLNAHLPTLLSQTRADAESQLKSQAEYFASLHQELKAAMLQELNVTVNEWMAAFDRERDLLQERYNERLTEELAKQGQVNDQRLENELLEQAIALRRRWLREIQSQVETERGGRLGKLAALEKSLGELTSLHSDSLTVYSKGERAKKTAVAVQALKDAALNRGGGFVTELSALKSISNGDELVRAIIASIDPEAYSKGIVSQADLASRFQSLSVELRKIALLPPDAGVAGHAASWMFSKLMFRQKGYVKGDDVDSRLARVEALLEGGQLEDATREVNSFAGWGRELSRDWLRDARRRLEVVQAIDVTPASRIIWANDV
jgi:MICOS complex subunit MIC60